MTLVPPVKGNRIAREKPPHESGQAHCAAPHQKVDMIQEQRPAIDTCSCEGCRIPKAHNKGLSILVFANNLSLLNPAHDIVMEGSGRIQTGASRHSGNLRPVVRTTSGTVFYYV
jgi:hypothetical protein